MKYRVKNELFSERVWSNIETVKSRASRMPWIGQQLIKVCNMKTANSLSLRGWIICSKFNNEGSMIRDDRPNINQKHKNDILKNRILSKLKNNKRVITPLLIRFLINTRIRTYWSYYLIIADYLISFIWKIYKDNL